MTSKYKWKLEEAGAASTLQLQLVSGIDVMNLAKRPIKYIVDTSQTWNPLCESKMDLVGAADLFPRAGIGVTIPCATCLTPQKAKPNKGPCARCLDQPCYDIAWPGQDTTKLPDLDYLDQFSIVHFSAFYQWSVSNPAWPWIPAMSIHDWTPPATITVENFGRVLSNQSDNCVWSTGDIKEIQIDTGPVPIRGDYEFYIVMHGDDATPGDAELFVKLATIYRDYIPPFVPPNHNWSPDRGGAFPSPRVVYWGGHYTCPAFSCNKTNTFVLDRPVPPASWTNNPYADIFNYGLGYLWMPSTLQVNPSDDCTNAGPYINPLTT